MRKCIPVEDVLTWTKRVTTDNCLQKGHRRKTQSYQRGLTQLAEERSLDPAWGFTLIFKPAGTQGSRHEQNCAFTTSGEAPMMNGI
jgi:hypothetical protein